LGKLVTGPNEGDDGHDPKEKELPKLCGGGVAIGVGKGDGMIDPINDGNIGAEREGCIWLIDGVRCANDIDGDGETGGNDINELFEVID